MCRSANKDTPCITKQPKNKTFYTEKNGVYTCNYKFPDLTPYEHEITNIYNICGREHISNYCMINNLTCIDEVLYLSNAIDYELSKLNKN